MKNLLSIYFLIFAFPIFLRAQTPEELNTFRLAQAFEQGGEYERSLQLFQNLLTLSPGNYAYFDGARRSLVQLKQYEPAVRLTLNRLKTTPGDVSLHASLGGLYFRLDQIDRADSVWDSLIRSHQKNQAICRLVAAVQMEHRLFEKAVTTYLTGRKETGDQFLFALDIASLYSLMMNYTDATAEYILMLRQNETQLEFIKSRIASYSGNSDARIRSIAATEDAVRRFPQSVVLLRLLSWLAAEGKDFEKAFVVMREIEQKISGRGEELFGFAERVIREKAFSIAARAYQSAIDKNQDGQFVPFAKFGIARCAEEVSAISDTATVIINAAGISPNETQPAVHGAMALYLAIAAQYPRTEVAVQSLFRVGLLRGERLFDNDGALTMFDSVISIAPGSPLIPAAYEAKGDVEIVKGNLKSASRYYETAQRSPFASGGMRMLMLRKRAEILYYEGQFDSSSAMLGELSGDVTGDEANDALMMRAFIEENRESKALAGFAHGELLIRRRKLTEALAVFDGVIKNFPDVSLADDAVIKKGIVLETMKRYEEAGALYGNYLAAVAKSPVREKILFMFAELNRTALNDRSRAISLYESLLSQYPQSLFSDHSRKRIRELRGEK